MSTTLDRLERAVPSRDADATRRLGSALASKARAGDVIALYGELGAGKTQLAKGFAKGLGVQQTVNSPSFVLMAEYPGRLPLFHLDLYRLADASEALAGGHNLVFACPATGAFASTSRTSGGRLTPRPP